MCGIWYSNKFLPSDSDLKNIKRRGPDGFSTHTNDLGYFAHSLLITKPPRYDQPAVNKHGVLLYNGSIYNVDNNDTIWIQENFDDNLEHCIDVIKNFRGEYALVYTTDKFVIFCTDQFNTRNLWFYYSPSEKTISISSTPDVLRKHHIGAWSCQENKIYILNKETWKIDKIENTHWNFDQKINHYDYVFEQFEESVKIRYTDTSMVPISSGYDSGVIACYLSEKLNLPIDVCAFKGNENLSILSDRLKKHKGTILKDEGSPEEFKTDVKQITLQKGSQGTGADRFSTLCNYSNSINKSIHLTGRGGDEIYSDYGFGGIQLASASGFGGYYPEDLSIIWPWYESSGRLLETNRLQDFMYGYFGIEARVPLLDQSLVQSWLNVSQKLKNSQYKGWMDEYMTYYNYPFDKSDFKRAGFHCTNSIEHNT